MIDFSKALKGNTAGGTEIARRESVSDAPFLSGKWWLAFYAQALRDAEENGVECNAVIVGQVMSTHKAHNGSYIALELIAHEGSPSSLELANTQGEVDEHEVVRIGNLAGFNHARRHSLREQELKFFVVGDVLRIACIGVTKATKEGYSDSPNFDIATIPSPSRKLKGGAF